MLGITSRILLRMLSAAVIVFMASSVEAQSIEDIKSSGVLKIGAQVAQVPWGFSDTSGELTGFDIEFSKMLAADLGVKPIFIGVTPANRTAALLTGQVDMLAAVMGIFEDRQKVVLFSRPYTTNETIVIGKAGLNVNGWSDMNGLRIGVPRGTPQDVAVTKANPAGAIVQRFDDDASTVQALISGQVELIGGSSVQVPNIAQVAGLGKFDKKFVIARAFNGVAVRPGSREWVDYINGFISKKIDSGELKGLFKQWIGGDLAELPSTGEGPAALPVSIAH